VVVDNSSSMAEEQQVLATSFFTLINALTAPTPDLGWEAAKSMRVGIVSSDLGSMYGEDFQTQISAMNNISGCDERAGGDSGALVTGADMVSEIAVESLHIACNPENPIQCPPDWTCPTDTCVAPGGVDQATVACPSIGDTNYYAEVSEAAPNTAMAIQIACMAQLGTDGCGVEQQLQASVRALIRSDQQFLREDHLLAVLVVSDEEDCSIRDNGLFSTPEWTGRELLNVACNLPEENETNYLFDPAYFRDRLIRFKGGRESAVVFAAIVGVPTNDTCQGIGDQIPDCLAAPEMQYEQAKFTVVTPDGTESTFTHFVPACERANASGDVVTSARPGRRYVKLAQAFGCAGYIYSICNDDWAPAMSEIARIIAACLVW
jgi:hypothetical protein